MDEETKSKIEQIAKQVALMEVIALMCRKAPKDQGGNIVVDIVWLRKYEMLFYAFKN